MYLIDLYLHRLLAEMGILLDPVVYLGCTCCSAPGTFSRFGRLIGFVKKFLGTLADALIYCVLVGVSTISTTYHRSGWQ